MTSCEMSTGFAPGLKAPNKYEIVPQGLKPTFMGRIGGTAEAVPFQSDDSEILYGVDGDPADDWTGAG